MNDANRDSSSSPRAQTSETGKALLPAVSPPVQQDPGPGALEKRLWSSADNLRANSNYASNEYFMPVMGLIFLRHAFSRYLAVKHKIEAELPTRGGKTRPLRKEDFSGKGAIYLRAEAQFDHLVALPDGQVRADALLHAMEIIEEDYEALKGILPKAEYQQLDNDVLGQLLRTFNDPALKSASGDVFGRIYEYFLTRFADLKAHDNGEFFTPVSLVQKIVNVIEPDRGAVLDPACGSGGMFVQSAHFVERLHENPMQALTFYGMEKNRTTIRLAAMNLAVHGLEGAIKQAITYYEDPHELLGKADFVMANPPFNVDEVDAEKISRDPRLPLGLPGTNKQKKVSNGNYLWISYFYSYLNATGRAGFVMSSQASSAGRDEATVRRKLVETGAVDVMIAIRGNFFYTRSVPCELWFLDRAKAAVIPGEDPESRAPSARGARYGLADRNHVLMLDARNVYRKVTRKIYDFSPEQLANLTSIVWLYRGQPERFLALVADHLGRAIHEARVCREPLAEYQSALNDLLNKLQTFLDAQAKDAAHAEPMQESTEAIDTFKGDCERFTTAADTFANQRTHSLSPVAGEGQGEGELDNGALHEAANSMAPIAEQSRDLVKDADQLYKLAGRLIDVCETELNAKQHDAWNNRDIARARKALDEARKATVEQLKLVRYFYKHARWLQERFPDAELRNVVGLVKRVTRKEIEANDWSLSPGRYVGVAPEDPDEDFDFEETLREIHVELQGLNAEAMDLAAKIAKNFEDLGV